MHSINDSSEETTTVANYDKTAGQNGKSAMINHSTAKYNRPKKSKKYPKASTKVVLDPKDSSSSTNANSDITAKLLVQFSTLNLNASNLPRVLESYIKLFRHQLGESNYSGLPPSEHISVYLDKNIASHSGYDQESKSAFQGFNPINSYIFDDFLYSQIDKLKLIDTGVLHPYYCTKCNKTMQGLKIRVVQCVDDDDSIDDGDIDDDQELVFEPITDENDPNQTETTDSEAIPELERVYDESMRISDITRPPLQCIYCSAANQNIIIRNQITFSHDSIQCEGIYKMINDNIPHLHKKQLLDIGSRLGNMLIVGAAYTNIKRFIGVEISEWFATQSQTMFKQLKLNQRIKIIADSIENRADLLQNSEIIIFFNPFELHVTKEKHIELLQFLYQNVQKSGKQYIIATPALEDIFQRVDLTNKINLDKWLEKIDNYQDSVLYRIR